MGKLTIPPFNINHLRLINQQIINSQCKTPEEVVSCLGAVQAQDYLNSLWAIGLRIPGSTMADIEQAISDRKIVRTWPMRGTLHFVLPEDVRWMLELLTPRIIRSSASIYRQRGLDDDVFNRSRKLFEKALQGGQQLTREKMYDVLEAANIATDNQRGINIIGHLAQNRLICHGSREGTQQTYVLLDEWIPATKPLTRDEALAKLAQLYFSGHGPATIQDFVWWSGLKVSDANSALESVKSVFIKEKIGPQEYWFSPKTHPEVTKGTTYLLPSFDEYILGYKDRSAVLERSNNKRVISVNGIFYATILHNGQVKGTWKRQRNKDKIAIETDPFTPFSETRRRAVVAAARRYAKFEGKKLARLS